MKKFAVLGESLAHSLSPLIHNTAFAALDLDAEYTKIEIPVDGFENAIQRLKENGYKGLNVTIPHKKNILPYLDEVSEEVNTTGAANTVKINANRWTGYNTDIRGFGRPLKKLGTRFSNCLVLGAGGAALAVLYSLIKNFNAAQITLAARDQQKAKSAIGRYEKIQENCDIVTRSLAELDQDLSEFDLVVNCTPLGTVPDTDKSVLPGSFKVKPGSVYYDLVYNPVETMFLRTARDSGENIKILGGLEMLIAQAAESFFIWTGQHMPVDIVRGAYLSFWQQMSTPPSEGPGEGF